jgi:TRAP-type C4-dicarboxylate transport system substrate-binding protein
MTMMRTRAFAALGAAVAVLALSAPAGAQPIQMKLGTATVAGDQNFWMAGVKEGLEKRAAGRIEAKLFPGDQLGAIPRQIEGLQLGTQECWVGPPGFVKGIEPRFQVMDALGLFRDTRHAHKTVTDPEFRDMFLGLAREKGLVGVGVWVANIVSVVSRSRPIKTIEDFRGLKLRVLASDFEVEEMKRLGASPTPMPLSEVLPSLQSGTIDGVRSTLVVFTPFKYWTFAKHLTETHQGIIPAVGFVSRSWWDKLPADIRAIIVEEGRRLEDATHEYGQTYNAGLREQWLKGGGEIVPFTDADRQKLAALLAPVSEAVAGKNPEVKKVYDLMARVAKKY